MNTIHPRRGGCGGRSGGDEGCGAVDGCRGKSGQGDREEGVCGVEFFVRVEVEVL